jgi:hypothetical protein
VSVLDSAQDACIIVLPKSVSDGRGVPLFDVLYNWVNGHAGSCSYQRSL